MTVKPVNPKSTDSMLMEIVNEFNKFTKTPTQFLSELPEEKCKSARDLLQSIYKVAVEEDVKNKDNVNILPELVVEDLDEEQIWQQLEIRNEAMMGHLNAEVIKLMNLPEENLEIRLNEEDEEQEEEGSDEEQEDDDGEEFDEEGSIEKEVTGVKRDKSEKGNIHLKDKKSNSRKSVVDDNFFKLNEMESFLQQEDANEMRKYNGEKQADDENAIDYFAEDETDEDDDDNNVNYKDFFGSDDELDKTNDNKANKDLVSRENAGEEEIQDTNENDDEVGEEEAQPEESEESNGKNMKHLLPASGSDSETESDADKEEMQQKSTFEMRQERLDVRMRDYEEEVLGEKPWQLKGEIVGLNRPQNSLLEEVLEFESTTRPAPIITEETTRRLEDIISQRIKDQAWDDVERKFKAQLTPQEFRKQTVLDQEKSKKSLAQIYESDYQKEVDKLNASTSNEKDEEKPAHKEIKRMMQALFVKLDALSNFHFVPKPFAPEARIITNTPAINMEEVAPIAISDANLLAPEEVFRGVKNGLLGKSERSRTDKKRERRKKKSKQRGINEVTEEKELRKQKLGIPLSKKEETAKALKSITKHKNVQKVNANNDKSALKSSKAFFTQLQEQTKVNANKKRKINTADAKKSLTAKKIKI